MSKQNGWENRGGIEGVEVYKDGRDKKGRTSIRSESLREEKRKKRINLKETTTTLEHGQLKKKKKDEKKIIKRESPEGLNHRDGVIKEGKGTRKKREVDDLDGKIREKRKLRMRSEPKTERFYIESGQEVK